MGFPLFSQAVSSQDLCLLLRLIRGDSIVLDGSGPTFGIEDKTVWLLVGAVRKRCDQEAVTVFKRFLCKNGNRRCVREAPFLRADSASKCTLILCFVCFERSVFCTFSQRLEAHLFPLVTYFHFTDEETNVGNLRVRLTFRH